MLARCVDIVMNFKLFHDNGCQLFATNAQRIACLTELIVCLYPVCLLLRNGLELTSTRPLNGIYDIIVILIMKNKYTLILLK